MIDTNFRFHRQILCFFRRSIYQRQLFLSFISKRVLYLTTKNHLLEPIRQIDRLFLWNSEISWRARKSMKWFTINSSLMVSPAPSKKYIKDLHMNLIRFTRWGARIISYEITAISWYSGILWQKLRNSEKRKKCTFTAK